MAQAHTLATVATAFGMAAGFLLVSVPPAQASAGSEEGGRTTWTIQPATDDDPDSRVSIRQVMGPGARETDGVVVTNFGPDTASFHVYASDGVVGAEGAFDVLPPDHEPTDGGSWVTFGEVDQARAQPDGTLLIELEPEESAAIPLIIDVPDDARPGDHPAGVVAELAAQADRAVEVTSRIGVRLHLQVEGEMEAQLVAEDVHAQWVPTWNPFAPGSVQVSYVVHNTGHVRLGARTTSEVATAFGLGSSSNTQELREVLPDQRVRMQSEHSLWGLVCSQLMIALQPHVVGEDELEVEPEGGTVTAGVWTVPWAQMALVVIIAVAVIAWRRRRRTAARRVQKRIDAAVAAATSGTG
ncbi:hypothetical protein [Ruania rhizosphaerae]|uniref:COG1470 family protein n=1 Tax=Ruania rhizosphaerae TaxID=1840413 RepID=UPI0013584C6B|nr:hypothetical protein [Ruania rhizosphaerae]